jgi:hypothetical protein
VGSRPAGDKAYQLLAQGRWFSPGTPAYSTTKTDRHDIAEILLKVALKHQKISQSTFLTINLVEEQFQNTVTSFTENIIEQVRTS